MSTKLALQRLSLDSKDLFHGLQWSPETAWRTRYYIPLSNPKSDMIQMSVHLLQSQFLYTQLQLNRLSCFVRNPQNKPYRPYHRQLDQNTTRQSL